VDCDAKAQLAMAVQLFLYEPIDPQLTETQIVPAGHKKLSHKYTTVSTESAMAAMLPVV